MCDCNDNYYDRIHDAFKEDKTMKKNESEKKSKFAKVKNTVKNWWIDNGSNVLFAAECIAGAATIFGVAWYCTDYGYKEGYNRGYNKGLKEGATTLVDAAYKHADDKAVILVDNFEGKGVKIVRCDDIFKF